MMRTRSEAWRFGKAVRQAKRANRENCQRFMLLIMEILSWVIKIVRARLAVPDRSPVVSLTGSTLLAAGTKVCREVFRIFALTGHFQFCTAFAAEVFFRGIGRFVDAPCEAIGFNEPFRLALWTCHDRHFCRDAGRRHHGDEVAGSASGRALFDCAG